MFKCDRCGDPTNNPEDEFAEHICEGCDQARSEAAWERFCGDFYGGSDPLTIREKQLDAWGRK